MTLTRRSFLGSILALAAAPAIVRADSLMRVVPRDITVFYGPSIPEMVARGGLEPLDTLPPGFGFRWEPFARTFSVVDRGNHDVTPAMQEQINRALAAHNAAHLADKLLAEPVRERKPTSRLERDAMRAQAAHRKIVRYADSELQLQRGTQYGIYLADLSMEESGLL